MSLHSPTSILLTSVLVFTLIDCGGVEPDIQEPDTELLVNLIGHDKFFSSIRPVEQARVLFSTNLDTTTVDVLAPTDVPGEYIYSSSNIPDGYLFSFHSLFEPDTTPVVGVSSGGSDTLNIHLWRIPPTEADCARYAELLPGEWVWYYSILQWPYYTVYTPEPGIVRTLVFNDDGRATMFDNDSLLWARDFSVSYQPGLIGCWLDLGYSLKTYIVTADSLIIDGEHVDLPIEFYYRNHTSSSTAFRSEQ